MLTLQTSARTGSDGILHFDLSVGPADVEYEVIVVLQPKSDVLPAAKPQEAISWEDFIDRTAGRWEGELARDQGTFEDRDPL